MSYRTSHGRHIAPRTRTLFLIATALVLGACSESASDALSDHTAPTVKLAKGSASVDSVLALTADVRDNLGIKRVHFDVTGGVTAALDTTFTTATTAANLSVSLAVPRSVAAGTTVMIAATAYDGAGNASVADTLRLAVGNLAPGTTAITSPASGTVVVVGKSLIIAISGKSPIKVVGLGYQTSGSFNSSDSTLFSSPLLDSTAITDTIAIPANAPTGSLIVTPFIRDSLGQRSLGTPITLTVQTASASNTQPAVTFGSTKRVEVTDTLHVDATDPNGISYVGYEIRKTPNSTDTALVKDSVRFDGTLIAVPKTFSLSLPASLFSDFPQTIYVRAFAHSSAPSSIRGYAKLANGTTREDTLTVVAGVTRALPLGGTVADALYHPGRDQLYLTNLDRNKVEVFNLTDSSFKAGIDVGSRPWGITAWPGNPNGTMGDTLLVANSGGTNVSYVNLNSMREVYRYQLPNFSVRTVTTTASTSAPGTFLEQTTAYDFSERPQFLAATCKALAGVCTDVILAYSTTPTPGQTVPFAQNNGTLRWENLTRTTLDYQKSHFFFEQALGQDPGHADTLEIIRYDATLPANDPHYAVTVVPAIQVLGEIDPVLHTKAYYAVSVRAKDLAFHDTTYVRNSGNFQRAVFGEGGLVTPNSRAMTYDANYGYQTVASGFAIPTPVVDLGVSASNSIVNFISNNSQRVSGVAINFDGSIVAIRGDSTYLINNNLVLQGLLPTTASNSGLDFHPSNGQLTPSSGLIFTASADANLEVWETCHYQRIATVPIRDPIIGPIKAAVRQSSGKLILFGVTAKGVVIITLPNDFRTTCT